MPKRGALSVPNFPTLRVAHSLVACARSQPLKEGEKREWQDWEYSYMTLMPLAFIIYGTAFVFRCAPG